jgi:hypothetical protein
VRTVPTDIVLNPAHHNVVFYAMGTIAEALVETRNGPHATRHTQTAQAAWV